jgi:uncharacterized protein with GYD domain
MPKYMISGNYVGEGLKGLLREGGSKRRDTITKLLEGMGGKMEGFYYAFGDDDVFVICDVPDNVTAAAIAMAVNASGAVSIKTTVLMTPEEVDQATKKTVNYRPPGA